MSTGTGSRQAGGRRGRLPVLVLAFGSPFVWVAVRAWLKWLDGRHAPNPAFAIAPLPTSASLGALLLPWLFAAGALVLVAVLLRLWWRRGGARAVKGVLLALWVLAWLGGAAALFVAHANTEQLAPLPPAELRVLGLRPRPATLRQVGGSEVVAEVSGLAGPQRLRIDDEHAALWQPGQRLRVVLAHGRFYGLYVTGWGLLEPAPAVQ